MTNEDITQRIKLLIQEKGLSQAEFSKQIRIDASNFSKHMSGKLPVNDSLLNKIVVNMGISKEWLVSGLGPQSYAESMNLIKTLSVAPDAIHNSQQQGAKVYDIDVTAGPLSRERMFSSDYVIGSIDIPYVRPDSHIVKVSGDSMKPVLCDGDYIAIREIKNTGIIFWGHIYVILLDDYRMVKYIRKHNDPKWIILRSENTEYDDIEIPKNEIRDLFIVENIIRIDSRL